MAWSDRPSAPFTLNVQLNADDYRRYFAIIVKRQSTRFNTVMFAGAFFAAIAVAFAFRSLAALESADRAVIEIVGRYSLFAYGIGVIAVLLVESIIRRRSIGGMLAGTPHAFDPKTVVLDAHAVSIKGKLSDVRWTWPAFTELVVTNRMLCLWIGAQNAVIVPARAFATEEELRSVIAFIEGKIGAAKQT